MPMLIILGALAGGVLAPSPTLAMLPPAVQMSTGLFVARPLAGLMYRRGRRLGFLLGAGSLTLGGLLAVLAMTSGQFALLVLAHLVLGAALIAINYLRFAAAESVAPERQAQAISLVLASGLIAALVGPELFRLTRDAGPVPLAGAYLVIAGLGLLGTLPVLSLGGMGKPKTAPPQAIPLAEALAIPGVRPAILAATVSQGLMVLLMAPAPLAMTAVGCTADQAAAAIRWHVLAMFAPGLVTGSLIRRFGTHTVLLTGMALLFAAGVAAVSGQTFGLFNLSLILLGVGWNFGFIGATHLLQSSTPASARASVQGANDTLVATASAIGAFGSGMLQTFWGWGWIGAAGLTVAAATWIFLRWRWSRAVHIA
ncbi:MFS transporter [Paracoccus xiamenensis]|uniref:MFS transporter n=1 Tax=Paracoccus xiamenensis TaxID=2714901 RepID=UPI001408FA28|nr:MFS transporter [Paracoccus xiamenensis]NHF74641.1 MFS transporter [Paracoccus xiamenensis]